MLSQSLIRGCRHYQTLPSQGLALTMCMIYATQVCYIIRKYDGGLMRNNACMHALDGMTTQNLLLVA